MTTTSGQHLFTTSEVRRDAHPLRSTIDRRQRTAIT